MNAAGAVRHNPRMLIRLALRDFAVVRSAELEFGQGLTVISGETGAGKSLLVDAMGFLSGQRADSGMVRHGAERAELSAEFALADAAPAQNWLRAHDYDDGDDCQLRRTLRADGGSRAWINGRQATLAQLSELAGLLVEIHGQHEHQALMSRQSQLALLDDFGGHAHALEQVRDTAAAWSALLRERERVGSLGDVSGRVALLEHELAELEREPLDPDAIAGLVASHRRHAHAASLIAACDDAAARIDGEDGPAVMRQLGQLRTTLQRASEHDARLAEAAHLLDAAGIQLGEALSLVDRVRSDLDLDPAQFEEMEQRLSRLHDLARKHRVPVDELASKQAAHAAELDSLRGAGERAGQLDVDIERAAAAWNDAAGELRTARVSAAATLSAKTTTLVAGLGMGGGTFGVALEPVATDRPDAQGSERAEFLVSANAGQPPRPLRKVASGGELSRISLAIEVAALGHDPVPTMVFDEVDSGIGGAVAEIVGRELRALGARRQVLCVTHLPQVAAQGHAHYRVSKAEASGVTQSAVERLDDAAREGELARMLGGVDVSREAHAAARKLLKDVR